MFSRISRVTILVTGFALVAATLGAPPNLRSDERSKPEARDAPLSDEHLREYRAMEERHEEMRRIDSPMMFACLALPIALLTGLAARSIWIAIATTRRARALRRRYLRGADPAT